MIDLSGLYIALVDFLTVLPPTEEARDFFFGPLLLYLASVKGRLKSMEGRRVGFYDLDVVGALEGGRGGDVDLAQAAMEFVE